MASRGGKSKSQPKSQTKSKSKPKSKAHTNAKSLAQAKPKPGKVANRRAAAPPEPDLGYRLVIRTYVARSSQVINPDLSVEVVNADGKVLASVPDKVRKSELWQQWVAIRDNHRARLADHARTVATWMVSGRAVSTAELVELYRDPAWRAVLSGLLVISPGEAGLLAGADRERGVGLITVDLESQWSTKGPWTIPHPIDLGGELEHWLECATAYGKPQGIPQLYRSTHRPTASELGERATARFGGLTLNNAAATSHGFNRRGWSTAAGRARRTFTTLDGTSATAEFAYFADGDSYGDWNQECTTGDLLFRDAAGEPLKLRDVPAAMFSEACVDVAELTGGRR